MGDVNCSGLEVPTSHECEILKMSMFLSGAIQEFPKKGRGKLLQSKIFARSCHAQGFFNFFLFLYFSITSRSSSTHYVYISMTEKGKNNG